MRTERSSSGLPLLLAILSVPTYLDAAYIGGFDVPDDAVWSGYTVSWPWRLCAVDIVCIPVGNYQHCLEPAPGRTGVWRVINWLGTGNGYALDTDLRDVTLTFETARGTLEWTFDTLRPVRGFRETTPFDLSLLSEPFTLNATARLSSLTIDPLYRSTPRSHFIADGELLRFGGTHFPGLTTGIVTGRIVLTLPEPASALLVLPALALGVLLRRRTRPRGEA